MPKGWDYGAYINYIDDKLVDCTSFYLRCSHNVLLRLLNDTV